MFHEKTTLVEIAFVGLDPFCNQNGYGDFKSISFRIICFSLRIMAVFIMFSYNAVIVSYLAIKIPLIPFRNLEGFSKDGRYLLSIPDQSFMHVYFKVILFLLN